MERSAAAAEHLERIAGFHVPDSHGAVGPGAGQHLAALAEAHREHIPFMTFQYSQLFAGAARIPDADGTIPARTGQPRVRDVGTIGEAVHRAGMLFEDIRLRAHVVQFPQFHRAVRTRACELQRVRAYRQAVNRSLVAEQLGGNLRLHIPNHDGAGAVAGDQVLLVGCEHGGLRGCTRPELAIRLERFQAVDLDFEIVRRGNEVLARGRDVETPDVPAAARQRLEVELIRHAVKADGAIF